MKNMKVIMATNHFGMSFYLSLPSALLSVSAPDILVSTLLRPGRIDRKIELQETISSWRLFACKIAARTSLRLKRQ